MSAPSRCQAYAKSAPAGVQSPGAAVSVSPRRAVPLTLGGAVLLGGAAPTVPVALL
jgi:hypothetical protein